MRGAICTICTELLDGARDVSACRCGHLFHADCLSPWLTQSMTCPQCRQKVTRATIIHKLFFSRPDADDSICGEATAAREVSQLASRLEDAQNKLCLRDREVGKLSAEMSALVDRIDQITESHRSLEALHRKELDNNKLLRQQLSTAQSAARQMSDAKKDAALLQKKVNELQNVQAVINGCQEDIDTLIRQTSDAMQLATYCTVYKSELARKRSECLGVSESLRKAKRDLDLARTKLSDQTTELSIANGRVAVLEEDIASQNEEMSGLRKKLDALEAALGSPSDTAAGVVRRLIKESPAPSLLTKTPKLSAPADQTRDFDLIDLDTSADLFATPRSSPARPPKKRPRLHERQKKTTENTFCVSSDVGKPTLLRTVEAVGKHATTAAFGNVSRNLPGKSRVGIPSSLLNINNKPSSANAVSRDVPFGVTVNFSSVFREGYNGLGGHEKVIVPPARTKHSVVFKKPVGGGGHLKRFFGPSKTAPSPPLPSLSLDDN